MKTGRKIISIDEEKCDGCGLCIPNCAEGAIRIVNGKAKLISESLCDGLGACLGECPKGALKVIEKEAEAFDPYAVEIHLQDRNQKKEGDATVMPCGCPSTLMRALKKEKPSRSEEGAVKERKNPSELTHWPVQIRLISPSAPFLKGADLLIAADCTPVAYPDFHRDFLKGRAVLIGCPKFDDVQGYIQKLKTIFETADIRRVTVLMMEVPCCRGLSVIVQKAMEQAQKTIPLEQVTLSVEGKIKN
jgi:NAD-dependent dihydropyrimidine dehydrogenase PreA subunit